MTRPGLTPDQAAAFARDGFLVVPRLYDAELMGLLLRIGKADRAMAGEFSLKDAAGRESRLRLRTMLPDDVYAAFVRSDRILVPMAQLLGGDVYHLHHKMMLKEPRVGGAWEWHQDYGYWYNDGFLFPHMASCSIAVDRAHRGNGCLRVLRGSHLMGRIEHGRFGQQVGADPERVAEAAKRLETVDVELEPGSAVFFHCNTLHCSASNTSDDPRWSLICCYSRADNQPYRPAHAAYEKLEPWDTARVKEVAARQWEAMASASPPA